MMESRCVHVQFQSTAYPVSASCCGEVNVQSCKWYCVIIDHAMHGQSQSAHPDRREISEHIGEPLIPGPCTTLSA